MKYNKLKSLLLSKEITITDFCEQIQITRQGLQKSLDNDLLPYNKVLQSCLILGITPNDFFEWEVDIPSVAAECVPYSQPQKQKGEIERLKEQIAELKKDKAFLMDQVSALTGAKKKAIA